MPSSFISSFILRACVFELKQFIHHLFVYLRLSLHVVSLTKSLVETTWVKLLFTFSSLAISRHLREFLHLMADSMELSVSPLKLKREVPIHVPITPPMKLISAITSQIKYSLLTVTMDSWRSMYLAWYGWSSQVAAWTARYCSFVHGLTVIFSSASWRASTKHLACSTDEHLGNCFKNVLSFLPYFDVSAGFCASPLDQT